METSNLTFDCLIDPGLIVLGLAEDLILGARERGAGIKCANVICRTSLK